MTRNRMFPYRDVTTWNDVTSTDDTSALVPPVGRTR